MMLTRKVMAEAVVVVVMLRAEAVAHQIEVAVLQSVAMEKMLVVEDRSAAVEAVVAKLAARSLAIIMTMVIGVTSSRASLSS